MSIPLMPVKRGRGRPPGQGFPMPLPAGRQHVAITLSYPEALAVAGVGYAAGVVEKLGGTVRGYAGWYTDEHKTKLTLLFRAAEAPAVTAGEELAWLKRVVGEQ